MDALVVFEDENVDLVLLDLMLPGGMDGVAFLHTLRRDRRWKHTPVLVVSSISDADFVKHIKAGGADGYLVKDKFEPAELLAQVRAAPRTRQGGVLTRPALPETRSMCGFAENPKHEVRNPKQAPKRKGRNTETAAPQVRQAAVSHSLLRGFEFVSGFVLRISCFPRPRAVLPGPARHPIPAIHYRAGRSTSCIAFSSDERSSSSLSSQIMTPPRWWSRAYSALRRRDCGSS